MLRASLLMVASAVLFGLMAVTIRLASKQLHAFEIAFFRSFFGFVFATPLLIRHGFAILRTDKLRFYFMRCIIGIVSMLAGFWAIVHLPLAQAISLSYSTPLFVTIGAVLFLGEVVRVRRWSAVLIGFLGVLVIAQPGADSFQIGALFALGNAILFGTVVAGVRGMSSTESTETLIMYQLSLLTLAYAVFLPFGFVMPTGFAALVMIGAGVGNGAAQYLWTRAIHLAPTSAVVPFQYIQLVWAMLLGFAIWGDLPTVALLIGSAIVIASGMFLFWHETRKVPVADAD